MLVRLPCPLTVGTFPIFGGRHTLLPIFSHLLSLCRSRRLRYYLLFCIFLCHCSDHEIIFWLFLFDFRLDFFLVRYCLFLLIRIDWKYSAVFVAFSSFVWFSFRSLFVLWILNMVMINWFVLFCLSVSPSCVFSLSFPVDYCWLLSFE